MCSFVVDIKRRNLSCIYNLYILDFCRIVRGYNKVNCNYLLVLIVDYSVFERV